MAMNRETIRIIITKALKVSVIIVLFSLSLNAFGQDKLALVIGNQSYKAGPLRNPINDARAMSQMLQFKLGFKVVELHDADLSEMGKHLGQFIDKVKDGGTALVYFAGHGAQFEEKNYLFPINLEADYAEDLPYVALPLQRILDRLNRKNKNGANIILLDACRNNPLMSKNRSYMRGLAEVKLHPNSYIAYATLANGVASDNPDSSNGLFTQALLKHMSTEGASLDTMIRQVRNDVQKASGGRQTPYGVNLLKKEFCFNGCPTSHSKESKQDQFSQTIAQLEPLAQQGNINAQARLGDLYVDIRKSSYDIDKGIFWYSKAAKQGNGHIQGYAQHQLARIYNPTATEGKYPGIEHNAELSFYWALKSAQQDISSSQSFADEISQEITLSSQIAVSDMYANGTGTHKDIKKSLMWLKKSAAGGFAEAQFWLGAQYEMGKLGVEKDFKQAFKWYQRAAKQDFRLAQFSLGALLGEGGNGLKVDHKLSSYWFEYAARNGVVWAQRRLGGNYCEGRGVTKSLQKCATWISKSHNNSFATQQDKDLAIMFWKKYNLDEVAR